MKALGWLAILLLLASTASAQTDALSAGRPWPSPPQRPTARPHPAVVRIVSPEKDSLSLGSGTLVAVTGMPGAEKGLVLTNWHVVRDAAAQITVVFSDGVRKAGRLLKLDPDWDLAAIEIDRPHVEPVDLADATPQRGDRLTIAGYGPGAYRAVAGRCTQFLSPGGGLPFEIVELSVAARQGDSGGPILNERGQLAGVLFGASQGTTSGSHCGRVRMFLDALPAGQPGASREGDTLLAARKPTWRENSIPGGGQWVASRRNKPPASPPERLPAVEDEAVAEEPVDYAAAAIESDTTDRELCDDRGWSPVDEPLGPAVDDALVANDASTTVENREVIARPSQRGLRNRDVSAPRDSETDYDRPVLAAMSAAEARTEQNGTAAAAGEDEYLTWHELAGRTSAEQFKSVLAAIGIVGLFLHGFRCLRLV